MEYQISVIIPALDEAQNLKELLPTLNGVEILVVDGASTDGTKQVALQLGAVVIDSIKGRAEQANAGAKRASGNVLYFLHADGRPPVGWQKMIIEELEQGAAAGCFRMKWNDGHILLRFFSWWTRFFREKFRGGDQSLFVKRALFEQIGGYKGLPLFEDVEIIERIAQHGRFTVIKSPIVTSARRYRKVGVWRLQWYYTILHTMYRMGYPMDRIKKQYDKTVGTY